MNRPVGGHLPHRLLAAGLFALLVLPDALHAQGNATQGAIRGRVADETTGEGVPFAQVDFLDGRTRVRGSTRTGPDGSFELAGVPAGQFRLRVQRLGYAYVATPYWRIAGGELLVLTVHIRPDAISLTPLEVTARARLQSPVLANFYQRLERRGNGTFITRADIERSGASRISDVLRNVPGLRLENAAGFGADGGSYVTFGRAPAGRSLCAAEVYVDGVLAQAGSAAGVPVDELATAMSLEGIEVYRGLSTIPPEFLGPNSRCGVVALWTRRGG